MDKSCLIYLLTFLGKVSEISGTQKTYWFFLSRWSICNLRTFRTGH